MTKQQHINYWVDTAQYDWTWAEGTFNTKTYPTEYFNQGDTFIEEIKKTGIEII